MRTARKESASGYYHIMTRGINKLEIFKTYEEKIKIMKILNQILDDMSIKIIAYCIMNNHLHLLIKSEKDSMSIFMKKVNIRYAMFYNKKEKRVGSVFQDRYKSKEIENEGYLFSALRYIHNNPVKAKLVENVTAYEWSSMTDFLLDEVNIIDKDEKEWILERFKGRKDFLNYHFLEDMYSHLDINEHMKEHEIEKANRIIVEYLQSKNISDINEIKNNNKIRERIIQILVNQTSLNAREIAEITKIARSTVSRLKTKIKSEQKRTVPQIPR